ncbi:MAG: AraC family transcriptional regulator [Akkermansiaceae bacterium]|nr:AraC family transcriptional regulator [Akkermansiaceae bacterium]
MPSNHFDDFTARLKPGQIALGLFEALPDVMFWIKDQAGEIIFVNRAYAQLLQRSPEELVGKTDESLFPATMAKFFRSDDEKVIRSAKPLHNKLEIVTRPGGGIEWRMTSKIPLFGEGGEVMGTAGVSRRLEHGEGPPLQTPHRAISELIDQIHENLGEDISVQTLARQSGMSVSSLERRFRQYLGTTPKQYLVRARITAACDQLLSSTLSIGQIATSLAYQEHASFTRAFISVMHMSPKDYRAFYRMPDKSVEPFLGLNPDSQQVRSSHFLK